MLINSSTTLMFIYLFLYVFLSHSVKLLCNLHNLHCVVYENTSPGNVLKNTDLIFFLVQTYIYLHNIAGLRFSVFSFQTNLKVQIVSIHEVGKLKSVFILHFDTCCSQCSERQWQQWKLITRKARKYNYRIILEQWKQGNYLQLPFRREHPTGK